MGFVLLSKREHRGERTFVSRPDGGFAQEAAAAQKSRRPHTKSRPTADLGHSGHPMEPDWVHRTAGRVISRETVEAHDLAWLQGALLAGKQLTGPG
jgi:hypothetical protein